MNNRIRETRRALDLSQEAFGERLGITGSGLSNIESGKRNVTEQMILAICREFNVNEEWLRTGEGGEESMFEEYDDTNISAVASEFDLDELSKIILTSYVDMDAKKRASLNGFIKEMADRVMAQGTQKARSRINAIIMNSHATEAVKLDLAGKAAVVLQEAFPYIGSGEIDESEVYAVDSEEQERTEWNKGLTEEEAVELVRQRYAAAKKGSVVSTTLGKAGNA